MKNLVFQYFLPYSNQTIGLPNWVKLGINSAKKYADTIGADYEFSDSVYMNSSLKVFESFRVIFDKKFDEYDNVLLLDIDMLINTKENIFDFDVDDIAMVHELGVYNRSPVPGASFTPSWWNNYFYDEQTGVVSYAKNNLDPKFKWKKSTLYPKEKFAIYNGGLQLWSKEGRLKARSLFDKKGHEKFYKVTKKGETPYLNMMLFHHDFKITELPTEWNRLNFQWTKDNNYGKITHFNDVVKDKMLSHGK